MCNGMKMCTTMIKKASQEWFRFRSLFRYEVCDTLSAWSWQAGDVGANTACDQGNPQGDKARAVQTCCTDSSMIASIGLQNGSHISSTWLQGLKRSFIE
uniref:AlNc14C18G1840 protein n=1 Tax=Albugo laibachii Nc14 TaxID=890382 RepID=F0W4L9_9STRA|nr:AlNc14C18G1840 [Albugo laibachii Nc14]|eukprot:CCA16053.1 AlNc14C18G1840 [Albugo laibachii Nc14]